MKMIEAIIKPYKLEEVRDALGELGVTGMTVTEVRGFGRLEGPVEHLRSRDHTFELLPKIRIEVVVPDRAADSTVAAVVKSARTGKTGDGKIFVAKIEQAVRIRTAETGDKAI
jgi:nitrogen regulatory protein P-II 1